MTSFMRKILLTLVCVALGSYSAVAQDTNTEEQEPEKVNRTLRNATEFYVAQEDFDAIKVFKKAYGKAEDRDEKALIAYQLADCYRHTYQYRLAEQQFKRAVKLRYGKPEAYIGHAQMLMAQGEYEDAIESWQEFAKAYPNDGRAAMGIKSCEDAVAWKRDITRYQVGLVKSLSSDYGDFGLSWSGRRDTYTEVIFSSMRKGGTANKKDGITGEPYSDLYKAPLLDANGEPMNTRRRRGNKNKVNEANVAREHKFGDPELLSDVINTKDHEGSGVFDSRRRTFYFTRCMDVRRAQLGCAIYSTKQAGVNWQDPSPVVLTQDSSESVGHPNLVTDKIMVFAGELNENGEGGKDIWITRQERRRWTEPVNLGKIVNTPGDELYPYYHDGYLYFASEGHPGMGGLDMFRVPMNENGEITGEVMNLRAPINSSADDYGLILKPSEGMEGYFVSNRPGGLGGSDIYSLFMVPLKHQISGVVLSSKDRTPISGVTIKVRGTNGFAQIVTTNARGEFMVESEEITADETYSFDLQRKKFLRAGAKTHTIGLKLEDYEFQNAANHFMHTAKVEGLMDPIEIPIVLPDVFFDLAKHDLRPESMVALDTVVRTLTRNPNIVIELRSHTDYRGDDDDNDALSQRRADTCVKYLISKGVRPERLVATGKGETTPFQIPQNYDGYGHESFEAGTQLTEANIRRMSAKKQEVANQINRRTDFRVLRDDYEPPVDETAAAEEAGGEEKKEVKKRGEVYTVGERESFGVICRNNGLELAQLRKLNGGLRGARPVPGMVLKVTVGGDYTWFDNDHRQVQRDETWRDIAKELGMKVRELRDLNPDVKEPIVGSYLRIQ